MLRLKLLLSIIIISFIGLQVHAQSGNKPCPCCGDEYAQFDFWVGDWVVYTDGRMVGFNKILKIESNCILRENWKSTVSSHTGTSFSFFNKATRKWNHVWIDNEGKSLNLSGEYKDRKMVLTSQEIRDERGNRVVNRITWYNNPDGTVRQYWEKSDDGGLAFSVQFDGLYRKRK